MPEKKPPRGEGFRRLLARRIFTRRFGSGAWEALNEEAAGRGGKLAANAVAAYLDLARRCIEDFESVERMIEDDE